MATSEPKHTTTVRTAQAVSEITVVSILESVSVMLLGVLLILSPHMWLPMLPFVLRSLLHFVVFGYVGSRILVHVLDGTVQLPRSRVTFVPIAFLIVLLPGFRTATQFGYIVNYPGAVGLFYVLLAHFESDRFHAEQFRGLIIAFVTSLLIIIGYATLVVFNLIPPILGTPFEVFPYINRLPKSTVAILGFTISPIRSTLNAGIAFAFFSAVWTANRKRRIRTLAAILAVGCALYAVFVVISLFFHGRTGFLYIGLVIGTLTTRWLFPQIAKLVFPALLPVSIITLFGMYIGIRLVENPTIIQIYSQFNDFTSARVVLWDNAVRLIISQPLGVGLDNIAEYLRIPRWYVGKSDVPHFGGMQNFVLDLGVNFGIVPFAVLIYWVTHVLRFATNLLTNTSSSVALFSSIVVCVVPFVGMVGGISPFGLYGSFYWWVSLAGCLTIYSEK